MNQQDVQNWDSNMLPYPKKQCTRLLRVRKTKPIDPDKIQTLCLETTQTSPIKLQYDKNDDEKLTYFGAKLKTDAKGKHRVVEVDEDGLASQVYLRNHDVILEVNKADVTNVSHGALLESLQDLGTQVQFLVYRETNIPRMKGLVYFRLGTLEGRNDATIKYKVGNSQVVKTLDSDIASVTLPPTETVNTLPSYTLDSANNTQLQQTKNISDTFLKVSNCKFVANNKARLCLYKYKMKSDPVKDGTIVALASVPEKDGSQYGLRYNKSGILGKKTFPDDMKKTGTDIPKNDFFFLMQSQSDSTVSISPVSDDPDLSLYLTSDEDNNACLLSSIIGDLSWTN